jgi:dihydrofolate synthase / folylpolyglutamate synthase
VQYADALRYLEEHTNWEQLLQGSRGAPPDIDRMRRFVAAMGDPQLACPTIHLTGTNGKGSTAEMVTRLLMAQGLTVGTYSSPHLERVNERIRLDGEPVDDDRFAEAVAAVADLEIVLGLRPTYFEILTAAAFWCFADAPVDVAVIEVGMLGTWDATNVVEPAVAVVTNVGLDHTEFAGPTLAHIAREKAGIVKPGCSLVLGETEPELAAIFRQRPSAEVFERDVDFAVLENQLALGGRQLVVRTPWALHADVFVPLHGRHQGDNASAALTAVEAFFAAPLTDDVVAEGLAAVRMPGRFEVLGHQPLVILDGAHNPGGADACATVFREDFDPAGDRHLVVGMLQGRDAEALLSALRADEFDTVTCCTAPSPRGMDAAEVAAAARALGCDVVRVVPDVARACSVAVGGAVAEDAVLITGSLYVVGEARPHLVRTLPG